MNEELFGALESAAKALEDVAQACDRPAAAKKYQAEADLIWEMVLSATVGDSPSERITSLRDREGVCWAMADVFLRSKDAHGLHDMGVEIQGIQWAIRELEALL